MSAVAKAKNAAVSSKDVNFPKEDVSFSFLQAPSLDLHFASTRSSFSEGINKPPVNQDEKAQSSLPDLACYHEQNQHFLEHGGMLHKMTLEETAERERQRLTKQRQEKDRAESKPSNMMTPAFVFRLNKPHAGKPVIAPSAGNVPPRMRHLEPIGDDDTWSEVVSVSSSGYCLSGSRNNSSVDFRVLAREPHSEQSSGNFNNSSGQGTKDNRDDEKYISSESSVGSPGKNIEKLTRDLCKRFPQPDQPAEQREGSVQSDDAVVLLPEYPEGTIEKKSKHRKPKKKKSHRSKKGEASYEIDIRQAKRIELKAKESKKTKKKWRDEKEEKYLQRYLTELECDRQMLMAEWQQEYDNAGGVNEDYNSFFSSVYASENCCRQCVDPLIQSVMTFLSFAEVFISNMPLTVGAVGLSWVTQGTIWFKFMEENIDACVPARYNSDRCTFGEFPGCFECDRSNPTYIAALSFHYFCHSVAFTCVLLFLLKVVLAWRVVADELSNPATSSPMGIVCITAECIFAGIFGKVGESIVLGVSIFHVLFSFWFLYSAIFKFRLLPDPSWYPNCIGLAYAAVKSWLYFPRVGKAFMALCMFYFFTMFFVGSIRVVTNQKIAAPVCFIGLSAPSITMYAMTILAQPSRHREEVIEADPSLMQHFELIHHDLYVPVMHGMMVFSLMGMASALHSLWTRWPTFKYKAFSPAHFAFIFPILSHTNAVQAYRSGVDTFAGIPIGSPFKIALFNYWFICLIAGTVANFIFTTKYVRRLPKWTKIDVSDEYDPPTSPSHTVVHEVMYESDAHESVLSQHFVSPAVLQANETGSLVRLQRGTEDWKKFGPYVRTRKVMSYGFDLTMTDAELRRERAELLHWVAVNAPRTRNRTLSHNEAFQSLLSSVMEEGDTGRLVPYGSLSGGNANEEREGSPPLNGGKHSRSHTFHHF
ncbi:expressed unknown protein [Seminavis robusta]|uniref:Transmembrane protein n=1 Tax=Seminavis robusta TaxID=568900 RepID=A0A9N8DUY9_9STRA|nr:expressed unknown protein [Seminavis robusta]|eukprot:Sro295_g110490.1 n/a (929) ;mRNA; f:52419-56050